MLKMSTDLLKVNRIEKTADAWILANAVTGNFVTYTAAGVGKPAIGDPAVAILTESNRDGTVGWTGDVGITGNMTVVSGQYSASTDQFVTTTIALNDKLYVNASGKLSNATDAALVTDANKVAAQIVAICTKAPYSMEYLGRTVSIINFVTV